MPKIINHKERRDLIVKTALQVFAENGEKDANLSLIAEKCGLSRGTVYQYFPNVHAIYLYAVKNVSDAAIQKYTSAEWTNKDDVIGTIKRMALDSISIADEYMSDIINLIKSLHAMQFDLPQEIKRRTAKIRLAASRVLRHGIKTGQVKQCKTEDAVETIMSLVGSYCFQKAYFPEYAHHIKDILVMYIESLKNV